MQVIPVNDTSVELSWTKVSTDVPCDGTKQFYKVQWRRKGRMAVIMQQTDEFSHVISGELFYNQLIVGKYQILILLGSFLPIITC